MALPTGRSDREYKKFIESTSGNVAIRVVPVDASGTPTDTVSLPATTPYFDSDGDNTAQALNASATKLYKLSVQNPNASIAFVQIFNAAAGDVIVGTTTPDYVIPVLGNSATVEDFVAPLDLGTAATYACTTTATGNGDPSTGLVVSAAYV